MPSDSGDPGWCYRHTCNMKEFCPQCLADECAEHITADRTRIMDLEDILSAFVPMHSGSCCTFDAEGKVIVTKESCKCGPITMRARLALHEWP
jgi:hypothetical protein